MSLKKNCFGQPIMSLLSDRFLRFWNDRRRMVHDPAKKKLRFSKCFIAKNAVIFIKACRCVPDGFYKPIGPVAKYGKVRKILVLM